MDKNTRILLLVLGVVFGMIGLSFASVPLYNLFCRVTGFGGTTQVSASAPDIVLDREITVRFNATTSRALPWSFEPEQPSVTIKVGQEALISFIAKNNSGIPTAGTALYNVTPAKVGKYFQKTQCFCFDEQVLTPRESIHMPVVFYVDPAIDKDKSMEDVKTITLSYSFFPAESEELDEALEAFYNGENAAIENSENN